MQKEERVIDKQDIVKDQHTSLLGRKDLFSLLCPFFSFHSYKKNYQLRFNNFSQGSKGNMELKNTNPEAPAHIHTHMRSHMHTYTILALPVPTKHLKEHRECKEVTEVQVSKQATKNYYQSDFYCLLPCRFTSHPFPRNYQNEPPVISIHCSANGISSTYHRPSRQQTTRTRNFLLPEWLWQANWSLLHALSQLPCNYKGKTLRLLVFC